MSVFDPDDEAVELGEPVAVDVADPERDADTEGVDERDGDEVEVVVDEAVDDVVADEDCETDVEGVVELEPERAPDAE